MVPERLRYWFVAHFIADIVFAVPLFVAPRWIMTTFGFSEIDPIATRLVAAALFGIGITSLVERKATRETFRAMLTLKVIWSGSAVLGILLSIIEGAPAFAWVLLAIFAIFNVVWLRYRLLLRSDASPSAL